MTEATIHVEKKDKILTVSLNRPECLNALNTELLVSLDEELTQISKSREVLAVIFVGAGEQAFCVGADLKERRKMTLTDTKNFVKRIGDTFLAIAALPIPTIAAINGVAFGGGLELALACDIRIANENVYMGLTECGLGIIPGAGGTQRLPQIVGVAHAKELIFTARRIDAMEALQIGLVNEVVPNGASAFQRCVEVAQVITKNAPLSVRAAKKAIDSGTNKTLEEGLRIEAACYEEILPTKDRLEALSAFAEKRPPQFQGR